MSMLKEFGPSIWFLAKFLGIYLAGNLLYGLYINSYVPEPDPVTIFVSEQTSFILSFLGQENETLVQGHKSGVLIYNDDRSVLSVFEGCNGLNVVIIFVGFLFAYGKPKKALLWFIPLGLLLIHLLNLARITILYYVTLYHPDLSYFMHKYLFTAIIYAGIFVLWIWWVVKLYPAANGKD